MSNETKHVGPVDVLAVALFEAYSRNSGNPPDCHYDRSAAEQWMRQALEEVGVVDLLTVVEWTTRASRISRHQRASLRAALANVGSAS